MKLQESGENYLETILILEKEKGAVRSIDVANHLDFTKASVSRAMSILREAGYLVMEKDGNLKLTDEGREKARSVYEKHCQIKRFFMEALEVGEETAEKDACRIEHVISDETFEQIKLWLETADAFEEMASKSGKE